jgi:hypothetical protein
MEDLLRQLLTYNHKANRRFIDAVLAAGPASDRIPAVLSHILNAHRIWNARLGGVSPTDDPRQVRPADVWAIRATTGARWPCCWGRRGSPRQ